MEEIKRYRLDLNKWETRHVFNKSKVWFKYSIFGEIDEWAYKKKPNKIYFDINKVPKQLHTDVQNTWHKITGL